MSEWLLDTNILSNLVRNPNGAAARQIDTKNDDDLCTSVIVACELRFGAAKRRSASLTAQLEKVLAAIAVLPLDEHVPPHYATIRAQLEQSGTPVGPNDLLIAAHALALGATLVTANVREFSRIEGLKLENWLE